MGIQKGWKMLRSFATRPLLKLAEIRNKITVCVRNRTIRISGKQTTAKTNN